MLIWAALLAGIAGYVDAISYLKLGGRFAANMTGNLVLVGLAAADLHWQAAAWSAAMVVCFLIGVLIARAVLRAHQAPRLSLLIEAAIVAAAASGRLGAGAIPVLAVALGLQNEASVHGIVAVNVSFITGDIQRLGERLVSEITPGRRRAGGPPRMILTVLVSYAAGAAIGAAAAGFAAAALALPAALLALAAALPGRWTGLRANP